MGRRPSRNRLLARAGLSCLMVGLCCAPGLALESSVLLTQYSQRTWTREHGLPQSSIRAITQSADGYLWLGTEQGLVRFDGVRFVTMELRGADGRLDGFVNALYAETDSLWVGTASGLYRLRLTDGELVEVLTEGGGALGEVNSVHRDSSSQLWIATAGELYQKRDGHAVPYQDSDGAGLINVISISESAGAKLCFANGRVTCLEEHIFHDLPILVEVAEGARCDFVAFDSTGALWVGTSGKGLLRFDNGEVKRWDTTEGLPHGFIRAPTVDRDGNIWFGCGASGVARIGRRGLEVLPSPKGQSSSKVVAIFEDRENNLWLGTNGDGLLRLSKGLFTPFSVPEGLREGSVNTVLEDHEGSIWIGTVGGGLHRLADGHIGVVGEGDGLPANDVISLAVDSQGRLWVGTGGAGAFVREGERFVPVEGAGPVVFSLHEDLGGRIWAGGLGGVRRLEEGKFQPVGSLRGINAAAIASRQEGEVWFANGNGSTVVWRDGEVTRLGEEEGYPGDLTLSLHHDAAGGVWIGAHLGGLTYVSGGVSFNFTTKQGLCDNSVFSIVEGPAGRLWMSSNLGVFAVAKDELEAVARGHASLVDCRLFGVADGMRSAECNGGQSPSAWRDHAGRIWYATVDGVARVDPREIVDIEPPPPVIEELMAGNEILPQPGDGSELVLLPNQREMAIRYTALTLTAPEQVRFRYRLEGLDESWVEAGERRVAYYTNLPPKQYRFHVQARAPGSSWGEPGATMTFSRQPSFRETRTSLALAFLALVLLTLAAHRGRVAVLRRRQRQLQDLVAAQTHELEAINNTLELRIEEGVEALRESDRLAAYGRLVAGVAHEVRHPIFALRAASHLLNQKLGSSDETRDELGILERETERMSRLLDDLLELGRPRELELEPCRPESLIDEALSSFSCHPDADLAFVTSTDKSLPSVLADRPAMIQVMVNLLQNACRHALGASQVTVGATMSDSGEMLHLRVADDGAGISRTDQSKIFEPFFSGTGGTGLGLAIASRLVRKHGGHLEVESTLGEGTVFTISLVPADSQTLR